MFGIEFLNWANICHFYFGLAVLIFAVNYFRRSELDRILEQVNSSIRVNNKALVFFNKHYELNTDKDTKETVDRIRKEQDKMLRIKAIIEE